MQTITKISDYINCLEQVKKTGEAITVINNMSLEENEKLSGEDLKGLDVIISYKDGKKYDEIKTLKSVIK